MLQCVEPGLQLPVHQPRYALSFHLLSCSQALHAQQSCQWSVVFATLLQSGKDATTSGKAAASQLSKGSRKSKAKSGVSTTITSNLHAADTNGLVCHTYTIEHMVSALLVCLDYQCPFCGMKLSYKHDSNLLNVCSTSAFLACMQISEPGMGCTCANLPPQLY